MPELSIVPLHEGDALRHTLNVIFVHGLGGDPITTWHPEGRPDDFWPKWLADDHPEIGVSLPKTKSDSIDGEVHAGRRW